jgi:hypothetical protein
MQEAQIAEQVKESERVKTRIQIEVVEPMIPALQRAVRCGITGDREICGFGKPDYSVVPPPPSRPQRQIEN